MEQRQPEQLFQKATAFVLLFLPFLATLANTLAFSASHNS